MAELNKRIDESLSSRTLEKSLTGKDNVTIDTSKFTVSSSGILTSTESQSSSNGSNSGATTKNNE